MRYILYVLLIMFVAGCGETSSTSEDRVSKGGESITIGGDELSVSQPSSGGDENAD